jgi:hypothetical protein
MPIAVFIFHLSITIEWTSAKFVIVDIHYRFGGRCNLGSCYSHITLYKKHKSRLNADLSFVFGTVFKYAIFVMKYE